MSDKNIKPSMYEFADKLQKFLDERQMYGEVSPINEMEMSVDISWGDWKHEHLYCDALVEEFFNNLKFKVVGAYTQVTEDDGSDTYSATHYYIVIPQYDIVVPQ